MNKDTTTASGNGSNATSANTLTKSSTTSSKGLATVIEILGLWQDDIARFNKTIGRVSIDQHEGCLVIVADVPGHTIGYATTDSGITITVDGKSVVAE